MPLLPHTQSTRVLLREGVLRERVEAAQARAQPAMDLCCVQPSLGAGRGVLPFQSNAGHEGVWCVVCVQCGVCAGACMRYRMSKGLSSPFTYINCPLTPHTHKHTHTHTNAHTHAGRGGGQRQYRALGHNRREERAAGQPRRGLGATYYARQEARCVCVWLVCMCMCVLRSFSLLPIHNTYHITLKSVRHTHPAHTHILHQSRGGQAVQRRDGVLLHTPAHHPSCGGGAL
jgi:hypothetical protein